MSTKIGVLSDTHGLLRDEVIEALRSCDVILHAGDINKREIIMRLQEIAPVYFVRGNNDYDWAEDLPYFIDTTIDGIRVYITHKMRSWEDCTAERCGEWAPTGISWEYRLAEESMISAYGDYLFYARPCEMEEGVDWAEEGEERYQPCCYNTVTGEETVLMCSCGLNCSVYAVNIS